MAISSLYGEDDLRLKNSLFQKTQPVLNGMNKYVRVRNMDTFCSNTDNSIQIALEAREENGELFSDFSVSDREKSSCADDDIHENEELSVGVLEICCNNCSNEEVVPKRNKGAKARNVCRFDSCQLKKKDLVLSKTYFIEKNGEIKKKTVFVPRLNVGAQIQKFPHKIKKHERIRYERRLSLMEHARA